MAERNLDDLVLLRSDGTPTYMLAVVVDDHDMGVTHIIRGDDHLTNGARQTQIYQALGWSVPIMAHIPLIHGPDGSKLSKRHGALGVDAYRAMGYLPEAVRNYLVRLGWSHGDQEIFSTEEMIAAFDLPQIGRSPARFDFAKLESLNGHYLRQSFRHRSGDPDRAPAAASRRTAPRSRRNGPPTQGQAGGGHAGPQGARQNLDRLIDSARFLYADRPIILDDKARALLNLQARGVLAELALDLRSVEPWTARSTEDAVRAFAERKEIKLGAVAQPLRAALTGRTTSPGIFDVLQVLGKTDSLDRLTDQAGHATINSSTACILGTTHRGPQVIDAGRSSARRTFDSLICVHNGRLVASRRLAIDHADHPVRRHFLWHAAVCDGRGLAVTLGLMNFVNLAHGAFAMAGATSPSCW